MIAIFSKLIYPHETITAVTSLSGENAEITSILNLCWNYRETCRKLYLIWLVERSWIVINGSIVKIIIRIIVNLYIWYILSFDIVVFIVICWLNNLLKYNHENFNLNGYMVI